MNALPSQHWLLVFGMASAFYADGGRSFMAGLFAGAFLVIAVLHIRAAMPRPQSNKVSKPL